MIRKNKVKRYSKIYRGYRKDRGLLFHVLIGLAVFVVVALVVYLIATCVNSYLNRERCVEVEVPQISSESSEEELSGDDGFVSDVEQSKESIVAVEIPEDKLNNSKYLMEFIQKAKDDKKNAIIVPLKNENGNLLYSSKIVEAKNWGTISKVAVDAHKIAVEIEAKDMVPIARVTAFYDQLAPHVKRNNSYGAISKNNTVYWFKNSVTQKSEKWLNPYQSVARKYICDIVGEVVGFGYKYVLLDGVSFPDTEFNSQVKTYDEGKSKSDILRQFFKELDDTGASYILLYNWKFLSEEKTANTIYGGKIFEYGAKKQAILIDVGNKPFIGDEEESVKKTIETLKKVDSSILVFPSMISGDNSNILDKFREYGIYSILNLKRQAV